MLLLYGNFSYLLLLLYNPSEDDAIYDATAAPVVAKLMICIMLELFQ